MSISREVRGYGFDLSLELNRASNKNPRVFQVGILFERIHHHKRSPLHIKSQSNRSGYICRPISATRMPKSAPATMSER